jgi:hypothetical protein
MLRRGLPGSAGQSLKQGGRVVDHHNSAFVGIDTSKLRNAIAVAEEGRFHVLASRNNKGGRLTAGRT